MPYPVVLPTGRVVNGMDPPQTYQLPQVQTPPPPPPGGWAPPQEWGAAPGPRPAQPGPPAATPTHTPPGVLPLPHQVRPQPHHSLPRHNMPHPPQNATAPPLDRHTPPAAATTPTELQQPHRVKALQEELEAEKAKAAKHTSILQDTLNTLSALLEDEKERAAELEERVAAERRETRAAVEAGEEEARDFHDRFSRYKEESHARVVAYMASQKEEFAQEKERLNQHYRATEAELQRRQVALEEQLAQKDAEAEALQKQMDQLRSSLDAGREECTSVVEGTKELKEELVQAQQMMRDAAEEKEAARVAFRTDRARLEQTVDLLAGEMQAIYDAKAKVEGDSQDKDALIASLKASNQSLAAENERVTQAANATSQANHLLRGDLDRIAAMAEALKRTAEDYAQLKQDLELGRCAVLDEYNGIPAQGSDAGGDEGGAEKRDGDAAAAADTPAVPAEGATEEGGDGEGDGGGGGGAAEGGEAGAEEEGAGQPKSGAPASLQMLPVSVEPSHSTHVVLSFSNAVLGDVHAGIKDAIVRMREGLGTSPPHAATPAGDRRKLTPPQVDHIRTVTTKTLDVVRPAETVFSRDAQDSDTGMGLMSVRHIKTSSAEDTARQNALFKVIESEWEAKPGDVLDELLSHLVTPDYAGDAEGVDPAAFNAARRLEILAEAANFARGLSRSNAPRGAHDPEPVAPYPGLNLMDCLLLRLYTMEGAEVDNMVFCNDVPSYLNRRAYSAYSVGSQNVALGKRIADAVSAMNAADGDIDEKALTALRPVLKMLALLTSLASMQHTSDSQAGSTLCVPVSAATFESLLPNASRTTRSGKPRRERYLMTSPVLSAADPLPTLHDDGPDGEPTHLLYLTNVRHGRYLQSLSMFPRERACLVPPGLFCEVVSDTPGREGPHNVNPFAAVLRVLDRIDSPFLDALVLKAKADSAKAAARLETIVAERDAAAAISAMHDRISELQTRHSMELRRYVQNEGRMKEEVDGMSDMVAKTQQLTAEAYKERDEALGRYADVERQRMAKELADEEVLHKAVPKGVGVPQMSACEDCGAKAAEILCSLCRGRFCGECSDRIHSGGVMRTHPLRLLHADGRRRSQHSINSQPLSPQSATELRRLENKYEKAREKCKTLKLDWAKLGETTRLLQQAEGEKAMLKEYIKRLEAENEGLRCTTGVTGHSIPNVPYTHEGARYGGGVPLAGQRR